MNKPMLVKQTELFGEGSTFNLESALRQAMSEKAQLANVSKKNGAPVKDLTGQRFGMLTVEQPTSERHHGGVVFLCRCDCGYTIRATGRHLQRSADPVSHCGCKGVYKNRRPAPGARGIDGWNMGKRTKGSQTTAFNALYATYRNGAINRGHQWDLTKEVFLDLTAGACNYCGAEPSQVFVREPHRFVYNGVDRVDSSQGYSTANCVSCCGLCNIAKMDHGVNEFLDWVERVHNHQEKIRSCR